MNAVRENIYELVDKELESANINFPQFASNHESYAVLLEEVEEARMEMDIVEAITKNIWKTTKENQPAEALFEQYTQLFEEAIGLATEAIQCAAMARKGIISNIEMRQIDRLERN